MHNFLRSIGFGKIKKRQEINALLQEIINHPDHKLISENEDGEVFAELSKDFSIVDSHMAKKPLQKCSTTLLILETQIKIILLVHCTPIRMAKI